MKLSEFRHAIKEYYDKEIGFNINHRYNDIALEVEYRLWGSGNTDHAFVDLVYVDKVKNRVFYVGKSDSLKSGWFSRKVPMLINANKFFEWASKKNKYDNFEVYFAWNYEYKDEDLFDYIPLTDKIEAKPDPKHLQKIILYADTGKSFKIKVHNLHEKLKATASQFS